MANAQRFPFVPIKNVLGEVLPRPMIPITLHNGVAQFRASGLLDTGADVNVLPYPYGEELGLIWDEQRTVLQLSGNLANYEARGVLLSAVVEPFASVRLAFAWSRAETVPLILGQVNFFQTFDVCFFRSQLFFELHSKANP